MTPVRVRVFVSSPGDVTEERAIVRRVLDQLQYDPMLRDKVLLDAVSWDDPRGPAPMLATLTPQEAVNRGLPKPSDSWLLVRKRYVICTCVPQCDRRSRRSETEERFLSMSNRPDDSRTQLFGIDVFV